MEQEYKKIFDIEGRAFVLPQGTWLATVQEYPAADIADHGLLRLRVEFKLQGTRIARSLELWIENAPSVTLVAESMGMLDAIQKWLEEPGGDDELFYDSEIKELVPLRKRREPRS